MTLQMHDAMIENCEYMTSHERACFHSINQLDGRWCGEMYCREEFLSPSRSYVFENRKLILNLGIRQ